MLGGLFEKKPEPKVTAIAPKNQEPVAVKPLTVKGDSSRYDRLKDWLRANEVALAERTLNDDSRLSHHKLAVYPAAKGGCLAYGVGCFANPKSPAYVLGDTHGDFDTFLATLEVILGLAKENDEKDPVVYILGDVVDRNGEGCMLECALILAILQGKLPEEFADLNTIRLGIIKGDHDIGLLYNEPYAPETRFKAMVSPADYVDWLNKRLDDGGDENVTKIGRAWIRLMKECPAAAFLEETGTLLSHGGVPREDLQKRVAAGEPYMLQSDAFAQDFEWCRMVDVKKKLLNRGSKTSEVGGLEFDSFCKIVFPGDAKDTTKVRRFVFGHQHPVKGFERYSKWYAGYDVFCIATFRADGVFGGPTIPHFVHIVPAKDVVEHDEFAGTDKVRHTDEAVQLYSLDFSFVSEEVAPSTEEDDEGEEPTKTAEMATNAESDIKLENKKLRLENEELKERLRQCTLAEAAGITPAADADTDKDAAPEPKEAISPIEPTPAAEPAEQSTI